MKLTEDYVILKNLGIKTIGKFSSPKKKEDWEFLEKLGEGSFSVNKVIRNTITGELQALKIYNKKNLTKGYFQDKPIDRVMKEVKIWQMFSNEHIPRLYEQYWNFEDNKMYVRSELGDLGTPGTFSSDFRSYTIKPEVYE